MLTLPAPPAAVQGRDRAPREFLPEVQALRALAVMLVVVYHFWPNRLHGGFVGVDVFFVISGFLITSHLHREVQTHGRVRLAAFYARRARRLLPAAALVLLASAAATLAFLPVTRWSDTAGELLASAFYGQNWLLAARAVDYSASQAAASPVQHFWSLSVEEQFYLFWPGLILLLLVLARRTRRLGRDGVLLAGILAVSGVSLAWSVHATSSDQATAYFATPTRIWELGAGAALALWLRMRADRPRGHRAPSPLGPSVLRWLGVAAIAAAALWLSSSSPFPGYLALLPVLGTVAVIAAGEPDRRDPASAAIRLRPVQFLGDVSYSLYLWHWPAIVVLPFVLDRLPTARDKVVLLGLCVLLAWLTSRLVEEPARRWRPLLRPAVTAAATAVVMLLVAGAALGVQRQADREGAETLERLAAAQADPCFGAGALVGSAGSCGDPFTTPVGPLAPGDAPWMTDPACTQTLTPMDMNTCRFGGDSPTRTVALVGDSHATHWRGALYELARELDWQVVELLRTGCPVTDARVVAFRGAPSSTETVEACRSWGQDVDAYLAGLAPDYVFTSGFAGVMTFEDPARSVEAGARGFADVWQRWVERGAEIFVLRDLPLTGDVDMPGCLALSPGDPAACSLPRADAVVPDALTAAAELAGSEGVRLVDLTDRFCDDERCYGAVGGAHVYFDRDHMTSSYARSLAPTLLERITDALD